MEPVSASEPAAAEGAAAGVHETVGPSPGVAPEQLEAIRDAWLAPLVAQITEQATTIGRLEARLDQERQRVVALETQLAAGDPEKDELIARLHRRVTQLAEELDAAESTAHDDAVDALRDRVSALETRQAHREQVASAAQTATDGHTKPRQRKWWLRLFGVDE